MFQPYFHPVAMMRKRDEEGTEEEEAEDLFVVHEEKKREKVVLDRTPALVSSLVSVPSVPLVQKESQVAVAKAAVVPWSETSQHNGLLRPKLRREHGLVKREELMSLIKKREAREESGGYRVLSNFRTTCNEPNSSCSDLRWFAMTALNPETGEPFIYYARAETLPASSDYGKSQSTMWYWLGPLIAAAVLLLSAAVGCGVASVIKKRRDEMYGGRGAPRGEGVSGRRSGEVSRHASRGNLRKSKNHSRGVSRRASGVNIGRTQ